MRIGQSSCTLLRGALLGALPLMFLLYGCSSTTETAKKAEEPKVTWPSIPGYEEMKIPADNPMTASKVELGKTLFYDKRLSADGTKSCYDCHLKEHGLTDGLPTSIGAFNAKLPRSSPTLWNVGYYSALYWDGRAPSLERQGMAAWTGPNMGVWGHGVQGKEDRVSSKEIADKIGAMPGYKEQFQHVFNGPATPENIIAAICAFERTIVADKSAWIRFRSGDQTAFTEEAKRGWVVFSEKAKCNNCHDGLLLADQQYHNVGIGMDAPKPDVGRFTVSKDEKDTGAFKTPTLLDISKSAPYFHNGSVATLEEAVDLMVNGGKKNKFLDTKNLKAVKLTKAEKTDLLAFLRALDVDYTVVEPKMP